MISDPERTSWRVIAAGITIAVCAVTWFVVAMFAMKEDLADALGEALGVALGFLVAFSVVGAVVSARGAPKPKNPPPQP